MPMLTARTLAEGQVYVALMAAAEPPDADAVPEPPVTGDEAWTLTYGDIRVEVPFASEQVSRRAGARYGLGVSQLVDAGQWSQVAASYARRAFDADMSLDPVAPSAEQVRRVDQRWAAAADAVREVLKFLPEGAGEVPSEAFWSELGQRLHAGEPERFTREKLLDDLEYYQGTLDDFRALHGTRG